MPDWNAAQYLQFQTQRTQPAVDLANRVPLENPADILDIGCGPGNSTRVLQQRFPNARILGIDSSPEMIKAAKAACPELSFLLCDAGRELQSLEQRFDLVFSNACIQWIPDHAALLRNMMALLKEGGVLAVQIPVNFEEPVHRIIGALAKSEKWRDRFPNPRVFYTLGKGAVRSGVKGRNGSSTFADGPFVHNSPQDCYGLTLSTSRPNGKAVYRASHDTGLKCRLQEISTPCRSTFADGHTSRPPQLTLCRKGRPFGCQGTCATAAGGGGKGAIRSGANGRSGSEQRPGRPFGCQEAYFDLLSELTGTFEIWQTTYVHRMKSHADIIEWYRSTGLRPYLEVLSPEERIAFEQEVYTEVVSAYPRQKNGEVLFRFPRLFFTAVRQKSDGDKKEETL